MSETEMTTPPSSADAPEHSWYRRLYLKVEALSQGPSALWAMLAVSVVDASFFPIPPFALLVPMVAARPKSWVKLAILGTLASLLGGIGGYYIGQWLGRGAESMFSINLDAPVNRFGIHSTVGQLLGDNFWVLALLCSVLPTPFKVVSIGSGMVNVPFPNFMLAAVIGRSVRYFVVAGVMAYFGPRARKWLRV